MGMHRQWNALASMAIAAAQLTSSAHPTHAAPSLTPEQKGAEHGGAAVVHPPGDNAASRPNSKTVQASAPLTRQNTPLVVRPSMLADNIEELAGQQVMLLNARVVGVFAPNAFLIEPASPYEEILGHRDRILVLVEGAALNVPAESLVAATVRVVGVARTLLGVRVSREVPWPARLDANLTQRLEVRAAVMAHSVRTAEGTELTACSSCTD